MLYAKQLGYLEAQIRIDANGKTIMQPPRINSYITAKQEIPLPRIAAGEYLIRALKKIGPTKKTADGELCLSWRDCLDYAKATQRLSEGWEMECLVDMSRQYINGKIIGENPLGIAPIDLERSKNG